MKNTMFICLLLLLVYPSTVSADPVTAQEIDSLTAVKLAVDRYNNLFSERYFINSVDKKYYPFPKIDPDFFEHMTKKSTHWAISHTPPADISVHINVALNGKWVEIVNVDFSAE